MFAKARLANLTIQGLEQSRAAVLSTLASAQSRRSHQYASGINSATGKMIVASTSAYGFPDTFPIRISANRTRGIGSKHSYTRHARPTRCPAKLNVNSICRIVNA